MPPDQYQTMLNSYASIVEKTNQQLSLWSNPYGLMIGFLAVLIAICAIVVSIILVNNSREQKRRREEFFDEQERLIKERNEREDKLAEARRKEAKKEFDALIQAKEKKLESADTENKEKIQTAIDELKAQLAISNLYTPPLTVAPSSVFSPYETSSLMICTQCGLSFSYYDENKNPLSPNYSRMYNPYSLYGLAGNNRQVHCPHCGAINIVQ